jgi:hypothetical protein
VFELDQPDFLLTEVERRMKIGIAHDVLCVLFGVRNVEVNLTCMESVLRSKVVGATRG